MMNKLLTIVIVAVFVVLALAHVYWAFGGRITWLAVVPEVKGRPAFTPSALAAFVVAGALFACASRGRGACVAKHSYLAYLRTCFGIAPASGG